MKILQIVPSYKPAYIYGGPIVSVSKLCESLSKANVTIKVLTTNANGDKNLDVAINEATIIDGVEVIYFNRISGDPHHLSPSLWKYLYKNAKYYDVIHVHSWWNLLVIVSAVVGLYRKTKIILSPRGMLSDYIFESKNNFLKKTLHNFIGKKILVRTYYHATSDQEATECSQLLPGWKGFNIPNIIALPDIEIVSPQNAIFTIGFMSRIDPKKGLELLFKAIRNISFPIKLVIAGKGEEFYEKNLQALALQLDISDKIEWVGWLSPEKKFNALMNFDLFVLTSFNENFANVVIESIHMGTPVCISNKVGLASFVKTSDMGWVTELDSESIREQLTSAYFHEEKRKQIREMGRLKISEAFSERILVQKYISMYEEVINRN